MMYLFTINFNQFNLFSSKVICYNFPFSHKSGRVSLNVIGCETNLYLSRLIVFPSISSTLKL